MYISMGYRGFYQIEILLVSAYRVFMYKVKCFSVVWVLMTSAIIITIPSVALLYIIMANSNNYQILLSLQIQLPKM